MGRSDEIKDDPDKIFTALKTTFGEGDTTPQLLLKFFSHKQGTEDLVTCSINLLETFEKVAKVDKTFKDGKHSILKDRLAEALKDDGLGRELRRLNIEVPDLTYFELRDRSVKWIGRGGRATTRMEKVNCKEKMIEDIVEKSCEEVTSDTKPISFFIH